MIAVPAGLFLDGQRRALGARGHTLGNTANQGSASRDRQTVCSARKAPTTSTTSPTLKTLLAGHESGTQKMSPRKRRRGASTAAELENSSESGSSPAAASASGSAGMTPPLAAIATRLSSPPAAMSHR